MCVCVIHGQPTALGLVRGRQLGNGLRGFIPRQGPTGLQAVRPCQGPGLWGCGLQVFRPCQGPVLPVLLDYVPWSWLGCIRLSTYNMAMVYGDLYRARDQQVYRLLGRARDLAFEAVVCRFLGRARDQCCLCFFAWLTGNHTLLSRLVWMTRA